MPLLEAAEQIRNLKLENGKLANSLASSEENLSAMIGKYEGACAELKAQQKAEKKLRADVARCASATMQLVGHVGKEESNSGE